MTAAALALAGCGVLPQQAGVQARPEQLDAQERVKRYQADIALALDRVDRDRLRAAAEKKPTVTVTVPATAPAVADSTVALASSAPSKTATVEPPVSPAPAPKAESNPATPAAATPVKAATALPTTATNTPAAAPAVATITPTTALPAADSVSTVNAVNIAPHVGDSSPIPSSIITPYTPPSASAASAMGAMTALATPAQVIAAEPAPVVKPAEPSLDDAMVVVRKNLEEHPTLNSALALALLKAENAGEVGKKLSTADQKVLSDLVAALEAMQGPEGSDGGGKEATGVTSVAQRAAPLLAAAKNWQQESDLSLPRIVLATRVDSFGVYTPVASTFEQGKRHTVIIYCEVANFASQKGDDGWFTTKLSQQETLITDDGLLVWRPNAEEIEDRSLNQRRDFYLVKKLTIPETLAAGKYILRMSVTDRNNNKIAVVSMPIEITIKP
jgi:hypothetical protein